MMDHAGLLDCNLQCNAMQNMAGYHFKENLGIAAHRPARLALLHLLANFKCMLVLLAQVWHTLTTPEPGISELLQCMNTEDMEVDGQRLTLRTSHATSSNQAHATNTSAHICAATYLRIISQATDQQLCRAHGGLQRPCEWH